MTLPELASITTADAAWILGTPLGPNCLEDFDLIEPLEELLFLEPVEVLFLEELSTAQAVSALEKRIPTARSEKVGWERKRDMS